MKDFVSFGEAYKEHLQQIVETPDFLVSPRGSACKEMLNANLYIRPDLLLFKNKKRNFDTVIKYLIGESLWYFGGRDDLAFIAEYAPFWESIANIDGTCNSAYGNLLFTMKDGGSLPTHAYTKVVLPKEAGADVAEMIKEEYEKSRLDPTYAVVTNFDFDIQAVPCRGVSQWEWAYNSLKNDKDTRQAVMHFNRPTHQYKSNKDFVCTMYANFLIRENKLYLKTTMRSQDIVRGLTYDAPFFCLLLQNMRLLLVDTYKDLKLGGLIHTADSLHLYEQHFELADNMLTENFEDTRVNLAAPLVDCQGKSTDFYQQLFNFVKDHKEEKDVYQRAFKMLSHV